MLTAALAILVTWALLAIVLIGVGSLVLRRFEKDCLLQDAFWLGLAVSMALLQLWNFLWPVNSAVAILLACFGGAGLLENRTPLFLRFKTALRDARWSTLLYLTVLTLLAVRASGPCDYGDTGLYGAQALRWILTYPAVPGLANVHGRLGFNSSVFLGIAGLSQGPWHGLGFHLFTGFLIAAIWFTLLPACSRLLRNSPASSADWFYSILIVPIGFWTTRAKMVGTLTDEPATIVCLVAVGILFEELQRDAKGNSRLAPARLLVAAALFALAVTFKESTIVFAFLGWCLALLRLWPPGTLAANRKSHIAAAIGLPAVIILPWCARGIILSGYPFFPATILGFPVDWKVPRPMAHWYFAGFSFWGRFEEMGIPPELQGLAWLRAWLSIVVHNRGAFQAPLFLSFAGLAPVLRFRLSKRNWNLQPWLWLLVPSLAGTLFWFLTSPALRFGQFSIWSTAGILGAWGLVSLTSGPRQELVTKAIVVGLCCLLIWCLIGFGWKQPYERLFAVKPLEPFPVAPLIERQTRSGLTVYMAAEGGNCWDAPLPCIEYFDETLRLRNPKSMRFGFQSNADEKILPRFQLDQP